MSRTPDMRTARPLPLMGVSLAATLVAAALGYFPTVRWAGVEGAKAMLAGCGVALAAGWVGVIPVCLMPSLGSGAAGAVNRILAASGVRMAVALALTLSVALSGWWPRTPLLVWIAAAYVWTLMIETVYLVWVMRVHEPGRHPNEDRRANGR